MAKRLERVSIRFVNNGGYIVRANYVENEDTPKQNFSDKETVYLEKKKAMEAIEKLLK